MDKKMSEEEKIHYEELTEITKKFQNLMLQSIKLNKTYHVFHAALVPILVNILGNFTKKELMEIINNSIELAEELLKDNGIKVKE